MMLQLGSEVNYGAYLAGVAVLLEAYFPLALPGFVPFLSVGCGTKTAKTGP
jgi:hypothetical protein